MLQLKNITKDYEVGDQKVNALKGIGIDFRKSEFVSILGPSGCGKTTLMNIIGGLDKYTTGDLIIDGRSTTDFKDADWDNYRNKRIGFIFQSYNLIPHLSVLGNVEIALTISGISKEERKKRAVAALEEVGLGDRLKQRPNQLSGGQMQRVAIARALVNQPQILLADEPTGALDTETSEQIMTLIKQIAENRLVIMVTHNADIAERYSTRLVRMLDGRITEDSQPFDASGERIEEKTVERTKKSSMSFFTALSLSWKNLFTKRGRTVLTSIAGSIGIIGIALILALSSGMNNYVSKLQSDMLSSTPVSISATSIDMAQAMEAMGDKKALESFPAIKKFFVAKAYDMNSMKIKNTITQEYVDYVKANLDKAWYSDIIYKTGLKMEFYGVKAGQTEYSNLVDAASQGSGMRGGSYAWQMMLKTDFTQTQYDLLEGKFPENKEEIVLIISETNEIEDATLIALGLKGVTEEKAEYDFSEVIGKEYKLVTNNLLYENNGEKFVKKVSKDINFDKALTLKVSGIIRIKETAEGGSLSNGVGYLKELYEWAQEKNFSSKIVQFMKDNPTINPIEGVAYEDSLIATAAELRESALRAFGGNKLPNDISIYAASYQAKDSIKAVLNKYNEGKTEAEIITYTDMAEFIGSAITSMIDIITYVLIAFTAISLVVSSIMIGIITYVSVLERTKEIGILRSIGARKKDVTGVFVAETFIIGLIAGVIGVSMAYLLSIPINIIISSLMDVKGIASLPVLYALLLVAISVLLTVISGLIPARKAAKKDPVAALRTE